MKTFLFHRSRHLSAFIVAVLLCAETLSSLAGNQIIAWGDNSLGQTNVPAGLTNVLGAAAGGWCNLALKPNRTLVGWGDTRLGQGSIPADLTNVVAMAAGAFHEMALTGDGRVLAWGNNDQGQTNVPAGLSNVIAIASGAYHCLALKADGTVATWGSSRVVNDFVPATVPAGLRDVVAVAGSCYESLALKADGTVVAWGGRGADFVPTGLSNVVAVAGGVSHMVALQSDGTLQLWGDNAFHQLEAPPGLTNVVAVAAGEFHTLALRKDGTVLAWGEAWSGQNLVAASVPTKLPAVAVIAAGFDHDLAVVGEGAPFIVTQPAGGQVLSGNTVRLVVAATGTPPLGYQWQLGGTNIPGATDSALLLTNLQPTQSGHYSVTVSNALGVAVSSNANLTVLALRIWTPPQDQVGFLGGGATFGVTPQGIGPFEYQWQFNGEGLPGATNSTLVLTNLSRAQTGHYSVIVSNAFASVTSTEAVLSVVPLAAWGYNRAGETKVPVQLSNVVAIAAGSQHNLVLKEDGSLLCWGALTNVPAGLSNVVAIAAGSQHNLALKADGTVAAWGGNTFGQTSVPAGLSNVVAVAGGIYHSLALKADGRLAAWGWSQAAYVPSGLSNVVAMAAGYAHNLALKADGTVTAWGNTTSGATAVPPSATNVVAVAASMSQSLALRADGTLVYWGDPGQTPPVGLSNVVAIACGYNQCLALKADGTVVNWGSTYDGITSVPAAAPNGLAHVTAIAAGGDHALALIGEGRPFLTTPLVGRSIAGWQTVEFFATAAGAWPLTYQWQHAGTNMPGATNALLTLANLQPEEAGEYSVIISNAFGVFISSPALLAVLPVAVTIQPTNQVALLGTTAAFTGRVVSDTAVSYQWQFNGNDLGGATNATLTLSNVQPSQAGRYCLKVMNGLTFALSQSVTLDVMPLIAWGNNPYGETNTPALLRNADVVAIAAGFNHSLALKADGTVVAWGAGTNTVLYAPPQCRQSIVPAGLSNVVAVAAGGYHSLALRADGTVVAWGYNLQGQTNVPASLTNAIAIAGGASHSLALRHDGTVAAWGYNSYGQVGGVSSWSNIVAIAAGDYCSFGLRADGTVLARGDFSTGSGYVPVFVPVDLTNAVALSARGSYALALRNDGSVAAWGYGSYGQTNVPASLTNAVAIAAGSSHCLAITPDRRVVAWGAGMTSQGCCGHYGQSQVPVGLTNALAVAAGGFHSLALVGTWPTIGAQPQSQTVTEGGTARFLVAATGTIPLRYQWQFNGLTLPGETNATLTLKSIQVPNAGTYAVVVANVLGAALSSNAVLRVNRLPVADASATPGLAVSPNGTNATVVMDGSRSYDPDGAPLLYAWFELGAADPLASGVVAMAVLPLGLHSLQLVVSDPWATTTNRVSVEIITTTEAVERLAALVESSTLAHRQPLSATLATSVASLGGGNRLTALNQLHAFKEQVRAQVLPVEPALAQTLLQAAQRVINALSPMPGKPASLVLESLVPQENGRPRIRVHGPPDAPGRLYIVEASTNLLNWEKVGVATDGGQTPVEFEDSHSAGSPVRFYRLLAP